MRKRINILLLLLVISAMANAQQLSSPDGRYTLRLDGLHYALQFDGNALVEGSLGVDIDNRLFESALGVPRGEYLNWSSDLELKGTEASSADTLWTPLYGENAQVRDCYNQLILHFEKGSNGQGTVSEGYDKRKYYAMDVVVRAYNEGVAFRYHFPETANSLFLHVTGEKTSFAFPDGTLAWYEEWAQGPYDLRPLKGEWFEAERPLLLQLPGGTYVALLEAGMKDYARGKFKLKKDNEIQMALYGSADLISPYDTPWRVIMAGEKAVDLINHKDLILNLCPERCVGDWSWVKPGKAFRSGKLAKDAIFKSINFCADMGFDYVELDAGWYGPEGKVESDARKVIETRDFTMPEVCAYARSKGIGVWVYVNQRALARQLDELLPLYEKWGIAGIKFGFVHIGSQQWSSWLHEAMEKCAQHHLMVDIHDEYRPTGLSRTYPNLLTQEGIRGNEEMPDAEHNVTLPFTRWLCGPADYTLCYFNSRVKNTKGHQLAMAAVYYSPLQFYFWYDNPYPRGWDSAELGFWQDCPVTFDRSIALDGVPGEYIVQARLSGNVWYVGAMTGKDGRTVTINTDFLPKGKYRVEVYNDDPSLNTLTKVKCSVIKKLKSGKPIVLELQPSGGAALKIVPLQ